jgi:hypothetical protein
MPSQAGSHVTPTSYISNCCLKTQDSFSVGHSVKLLLAFTSTIIPDFSFLEIHGQDLYSLLDMHVFWNGAPSSTKEGSVFLYRPLGLLHRSFSMSIYALSWRTGHCGFGQSQSYFMIGGLPPLSSSWHQAHWVIALMSHHLWWEDGFVSYEYALPLSSVCIAHIACYWKFFLVHYIQVLC